MLLLMNKRWYNDLKERVNYIVVDSLSEYTKKTATTLDLKSFNRESLEEAISKFKENSSEIHWSYL